MAPIVIVQIFDQGAESGIIKLAPENYVLIVAVICPQLFQVYPLESNNV